ncbi:hypothetical protein L6164_029376 [Bauhinia variegata]|uniref:Uncharacterized protein n=1 Tax=Bauhinia variegata TaxID=167791 RepID=A0ACB9L952_BAUVA|nr:hypothetical protein L6164_029376 [Bauhinia variegata]
MSLLAAERSFETKRREFFLSNPLYLRRRRKVRPPLSPFGLSSSGVFPGIAREVHWRKVMGSEIDILEGRLTSLLHQLQSECGILNRMIYKNKNQHRRCSYFQYLLKVRRDVRLLQLANLEEIVRSCFLVIRGDRPKQKVHLLESLKRRKCDGEKYNFMERLLGVARLLAQMVEPMLKAATYPSTVSMLFLTASSVNWLF